MSNYTDGPTDQTWEVVTRGTFNPRTFVQRQGWVDRNWPTGMEIVYEFEVSDSAVDLAARLNRLDTAERELAARTAALRRLVEAASASFAPLTTEHTHRKQRQALILAAQAAREVLDGKPKP